MTFEELLLALGHMSCLAASIYVLKSGQRLAGIFLFVGFSLQAQAFAFVVYGSTPILGSECLANPTNYYSCMSFVQKGSMHLGQIAPLIIAGGIFLFGHQHVRRANAT